MILVEINEMLIGFVAWLQVWSMFMSSQYHVAVLRGNQATIWCPFEVL